MLLFDAEVYNPDLRKRGLSVVTVANKLQYSAELRSEAVYRIEGAIIHIGHSSVRHAQKMFNARTGETVASFLGIDALFDLTARRTTPWPPDLRATLEAQRTELLGEDRKFFEP